MLAPTYRWRCHKCELVNEPGVSMCAHCGFPAVASAIEIGAAKGQPLPPPYGPLGRALARLATAIGPIYYDARQFPELRHCSKRRRGAIIRVSSRRGGGALFLRVVLVFVLVLALIPIAQKLGWRPLKNDWNIVLAGIFAWLFLMGYRLWELNVSIRRMVQHYLTTRAQGRAAMLAFYSRKRFRRAELASNVP